MSTVRCRTGPAGADRSSGPRESWTKRVNFAPMPRNEPDVEILHRDARVVAVAKPAGLTTTRDRWAEDVVTVRDRAEARLAAEEGAEVSLRGVHRLDKETSGVMIFACDPDAGRDLSRQFRHREVKKDYLALIAGAPHPAEGTIELRLDRDPRRPGAMRVVKRHGKVSTTRYRTETRYRGFALLRVRPETGRTHQIRVHLAAAGMPLAIDALYGGEREDIRLSELKATYRPSRRRPEAPLIGRLTLHAERLVFAHPDTGETTEVVAPLPKDFALVLRNLDRYQSLRTRERAGARPKRRRGGRR
jgi:23S rRNA pseudouridine1911/1915/1917 synthase